jgi:hypothetical protein
VYDLVAALRTLVLPYGQPANSPQVIINESPVRTELQTLYSNKVIADFIFQQFTHDYVYMALVVPTVGKPFLAFGAIESVSLVISEAFRVVAGTFGVPSLLQVVGRLDVSTAINSAADSSFNGVSLGRGVQAYSENNAAIGPSGAGVEMLCFASKVFDRIQGRAYRVRVFGWVTHSVAGAFDIRIRDTNSILGAVLKVFRTPNPNAGVPQPFEWTTILKHTSGTQLASQVNFTLQSISGGTVTLSGAATLQPALEVDDWGNSTTLADAENL